MRAIQDCAAIAALIFCATLARADGAFYKLPKDGTWATYQVDASESGAYPKSRKGSLRMASVGQVTEKGEPCRWIEVTWQLKVRENGKKARKDTRDTRKEKVLIPERFLAKHESPMDHIIRAWRQEEKGPPKEVKEPNDIGEGPLPILLSGPIKDGKTLAKTEVESKLGKLSCEGVSGRLELTSKYQGVFKFFLENRLHPDAPFGVVINHWTLESPPGLEVGTMDWTMKLIDYGDKATSEMPDAK
jgi:hypothetical protein